jgi:hypothetical protein
MPFWHPSHAAIEVQPGVWHMPDPLDTPYAIVRLIRVGDEHGYRVTTYAEPRELIGYYRSHKAACMGAHQWFVRSRHGRDRPNPGWA